MNNTLASHKSEHDDSYDQHSLPILEPKSGSPVEIENDRAGKHSKGTGSSLISASVKRKSSKNLSKPPKVARFSPANEDRSHHGRDYRTQEDIYNAKSSCPKHDEDVYSSQNCTAQNVDQDIYESQKHTSPKTIFSSRKSVTYKHNASAERMRKIQLATFKEACAPPPAAQE